MNLKFSEIRSQPECLIPDTSTWLGQWLYLIVSTLYVDELSPFLIGPELTNHWSDSSWGQFSSENLKFRYRDWRSPECEHTYCQVVETWVDPFQQSRCWYFLRSFGCSPLKVHMMAHHLFNKSSFGLKFAVNFFLVTPKAETERQELC